MADFAVDIVAGNTSCLHGDQLLIAYCISTLISSSRPSKHLTHSPAIHSGSFLSSSLFLFFFMVSWVGSPRIIHIPFSWLGGSSAQNHDFFSSYLRGSYFLFFKRIVIDHFELWILDWPVGSSKNTWCVCFFLWVPGFLDEK